MKQTLLLIFGCLLLSCQQPKQITAIIPITPSTPSIKGNWQGVMKYQFKYYKRFICFDDSFCITYNLGRLKYYIHNDSVMMENVLRNGYHQKRQYAIKKLTGDSLELLAPATRDYPADTMSLNRVYKKNTIKPSTIYFASSVCYGSCPAMYLQINSDRTIAFYGLRYTGKEGGSSGKLSESEYATILNMINNLPVDSLKEFYHSHSSDASTRGVAIETDGKLIESTALGTNAEPVELNMLLTKLLYVYEHTPLKADTTVSRDYFSKLPAGKLLTGRTTFPEPK